MKNNKKPALFHRIWFGLIAASLIIFISSVPASAHKVILFACVKGDTVFTESYFSDGKRCQNSTIEVFDRNEKKLLTGKTNKNGEFSFKVPNKTGLRLVLKAAMGHRAEFSIPANELPNVFNKINKKSSPGSNRRETVPPGISCKAAISCPKAIPADLKNIQLLMEETLDKKLQPIMIELKKSQEKKISLGEVVGGIGYIFGLMGIIIYFINQKTKKA